jgi:hypothetical protein
MKGATPDEDAKINSRPNNNKSITIGMSHHNLRAHKNRTISPITPVLVIIPLTKFPMITCLLSEFVAGLFLAVA